MKTGTAFRSLVATIATIAALSPAAATFAQGSKQDELIAEYCERFAAADPASADDFFALGEWCRESELASQATRAFTIAVAIDADHAGARDALGFVRHGTDWLPRGAVASRAGAKPASGGSSRRAADTPGGADAPDSPARETGRATAEAVPQPESTDETMTDADPVAQAIAAKKAWADEAAATFRSEFQLHEDADLLLYTTHDSLRHADVRALRGWIAASRKALSGFLGVRSTEAIWPEKLLVVLLRSAEEYERFADIVDGIASVANPDGTYIGDGGHVVTWNPESRALVRVMGDSALDRLHGSPKPVGWWLAEGVGELLAAHIQAESGDTDLYESNYVYAADSLSSERDRTTIYTLLETPNYRDRERTRKRALAMTLVDFLHREQGRRFRSLIEALKGEDAPPPPSTDSEDEQKSYWLSYLSYQEEVLEDTVGGAERLEAAWVRHVTALAAKLQAR